MMDNDSIARLNLITRIVEQHGCRIVDVDFDTHRIDLDGPQDKQALCALALAEVLGE